MPEPINPATSAQSPVASEAQVEARALVPLVPAGRLRIGWRIFRRHKPGMVGLVILAALYFIAIFADFLAPYSYENEARDLQWSPPTRLHFVADGHFGFRPYIHPKRSFIDEDFNIRQEEDFAKRCYLRFFVQGDEHRLLGVFQTRWRLFGVDPLAAAVVKTSGDTYYSRLYLVGSDTSGRDIFSRLLYGSRISMSIGIIATSIVLVIGLFVGGVSGYFVGPVDDILQRICEMIMLLPGFYLLLMLRFMFPASMDSVKIYFCVVLIMSLIAWPGLARVIRGMVLSVRTMDFVHAARAIGQSPLRIIWNHVLPNTYGYVIVSATLGIPGYILGESGLSLLGLGIMEPIPSWGNMLQKAMDIVELDQHPWVLCPGVCIFLAVMAFNLVGDGLRDALDPRQRKVQ